MPGAFPIPALRAVAAASSLWLAAAVAPVHAQDKPGPMQSGRHVQGATTEKSAPDTANGSSGATPAGFNVPQLFATSCGWCHFKGGRENGKGPKLMGTTLTDAEIVTRIRNGKPGQMPAFGTAFNDDQLKAIVTYIRELKP